MNKKLLPLALCLVALLTACASAETLSGTAEGYGGPLTVSVMMDGSNITAVEIVSHNETQSVAGTALEKIPQEILAKNSADVDVVTGATYTSRAIMNAVKEAINPGSGAPAATNAPTGTGTAGLGSDYAMGSGIHTSGRVGPGKDNTDTQIYSFNVVMANAIFDKDGRIVDIHIDQLEVATPNYDSATMPQFSGFPGQGGYNWDKNGTGTVEGKTPDTDENFLDEISRWKTKRDRGETYKMNTGTWTQQIDTFERVFIGKTVAEIDEWFRNYCSDRNGRPLKAGSEDAQDAAKWDKLSDQDKSMLADVTTSATMSLNDAHGNIIAAIHAAYDNRVQMGQESGLGGTGTNNTPAATMGPTVAPIVPTAAPGSTVNPGNG